MPTASRLSLSIHHGPFLLLVAVGRARRSDLNGIGELCAGISRTQPYTRILCDFTALELEISDEDRIASGVHAAKVLAHLSRVAVVVDPGFYNGLAQQAALAAAGGSGLNLRIFTDLREGTEWLSEV